MSQMLVRVADSLHSRVNDLSVTNGDIVERAVRHYLSDRVESDARHQASLLQDRAEFHEREAERLRGMVEEHEEKAAEAREEAQEHLRDAETASSVDVEDARGVEEHVDRIKTHLDEQDEAIVFPSHGMVEDAVAETGVTPESLFEVLEDRGVDPERLRDSGGGV